jgi:small conductance mechanosensitive channel
MYITIMEKLNTYFEIAIDKVVFYTPKLIAAAFILWLSFKLIKKVLILLERTLKKLQVSDTMRPFLLSMISVILKAALLFIVVSILGADLSGLLTVVAAMGFAIGMSLQGSLGNFASGILILFLKPYKVNDWIQIDDKFGKVEEIGIFNTEIITPGNKTMIIPNSKITDDVVTNYSKKGVIRLEISVTMPYAEDFPKVQHIITTVLNGIDNILDQPEPVVGIEAFDSHSIIVGVRPYVKPDDYWEVTYLVHHRIKKAFNEHQIKVAYSEGVELGAIGA